MLDSFHRQWDCQNPHIELLRQNQGHFVHWDSIQGQGRLKNEKSLPKNETSFEINFWTLQKEMCRVKRMFWPIKMFRSNSQKELAAFHAFAKGPSLWTKKLLTLELVWASLSRSLVVEITLSLSTSSSSSSSSSSLNSDELDSQIESISTKQKGTIRTFV